MVIAFLLLAFVLPRQAIRNLEVTKEFTEFCFEGDEVRVKIGVRNRGRSPVFLISMAEIITSEHFQKSEDKSFLIPELMGGETKTFEYSLRSILRGIIRLPASRVSTSFPFGFFQKTHVAPTPQELTIYPVAPAPGRLKGERIGGHLAGYRRSSPLIGRSFDFLGIREYHQSDETRFIHWPSSARLNKLMIKEFRDLQNQALAVLLDMHESSSAGRGRESTTEYVVKIATSLLNYSLRERIFLTMQCSQGHQIVTADNSRRYVALEFLASLVHNGKLTTSQVLAHRLNTIQPGSHLFLLQAVPEIDVDLLESLIERKIFVTILLILGHSFTDERRTLFDNEKYWEIRERLEGMGVRVYMVRKGDHPGRIFDSNVQEAEENLAGEVHTASSQP
jgi:uncharacterized protein (DUF58 family)